MKNNIVNQLKSITLVALLSTATLTSFNAFAFEGRQMHEGGEMFGHLEGQKHKKHHHRKMAKFLRLSDDQKTQMKSISQSAKNEAGELRELLTTYKEQVKLFFATESFDEAAFANLHAEYQANFAQLALLRAKTKHAIFNVLTTEQQEKWEEKMEERKEKGKRNKKG